MKKLALLSFLGLMMLTAHAQNASDNAMVTISGAKADASQQSTGMTADEFNRFAGSYELSNGSSIALFSRGLKKYVALHGEAWHEVVATSANTFVAKDSQLKVDIYREDDGAVHGDVYLPRSEVQTASSGTAGGHLVKVSFH